MKLHPIYLLVFCLLITTKTFATDGQHRPFNEMHGGCKNFTTPLQSEFALWNGAATPLISAKIAKDNGPLLKLNTKTNIELYPQSQVTLLVAPGKVFTDHPHVYAGLVTLEVPSDGIYRISAGKHLWFDIVDTKTRKRIDSVQFEMQTQCKQIFKTVAFPLQANRSYYLQISSSPKRKVGFLLSNTINYSMADRPV